MHVYTPRRTWTRVTTKPIDIPHAALYQINSDE